MTVVITTALVLGQLLTQCFCYQRPLNSVLADLEQMDNRPFMSEAETKKLATLFCARPVATLIEFGSGGSTILAALCNVHNLYSVDSSHDWLDRLALSPVWNVSRTSWYRFWADIGPLADFGTPRLNAHSGFDKYSRVFDLIPSATAQVIFVDGRFRVACALLSLRFMGPGSLLVVHDYTRQHYHVIEEFYKKIDQTETLAVFQRRDVVNLTRWYELVDQYKRNAD